MTTLETSVLSDEQQQQILHNQTSNSNNNNEGALKGQNIQQDTPANENDQKERKRSRSSRKHKKEKDQKKKDRKSEKDRRSRSNSEKKKRDEKSKRRRSSSRDQRKSKSDKDRSSSRHRSKREKDRKRSSSRNRRSSRSKRDKSRKRHETSKRKRRHHSSSSSSSSSSSASSDRSKSRRRRRSSSLSKKKLSEAELRRIEREKRNLGEYYSQLKNSSKSKERKKKNKENDKFCDSNNMQVDTEKFFYDGFQWLPRISKNNRPDDIILKQTEKQRKIQLQNVPLELGLDKLDIISYVNHFMKEKHLANEGNDTPVIDCEINEENKTANIEFSSVEETNLMYKLGSFQFFQTECKLFRICDNHLTQPSVAALTQLAIREAEVAAQLIKVTENLFQDSGDDKNKNKKSELVSTIIKVTNTIQLGTEGTLTEENWQDLHADLLSEFERYGTIEFHFIIRPYQATVGAKAGTLFVQYATKEAVQLAIQTNQGRLFNGQSLKIYNIPEDGFNLNFRPLLQIR
ncbi:hypothetical protein ABPG72_011881 [Tetrahymena utriculariae]